MVKAIQTSTSRASKRKTEDSRLLLREPLETTDARDEEEGDSLDDALSYSDDSASLSDAYFCPQSDDDLARPLRYRQEDAVKAGLADRSYGSINGPERALSPLWKAGPIKEDSELEPMDFEANEISSLNNPDSLFGSKKDRKQQKRQRKEEHQKLRKQLEQAARERAVDKIRGETQNLSEWKDTTFAFLFLVQLFLVIGCAAMFGVSVVVFNDESMWTREMPWNNFDSRRLDTGAGLTAGAATDDAAFGSGIVYPDPLPAAYIDTTKLGDYGSFTIHYQNVIGLVAITGVYACVLTYLSFGFMLILSTSLIQIMLVFSVLVALAWGMIGLTLDPYGAISIMGFSALLVTLAYTVYSWRHIPFAATNLHVAMTAIRCTADITLLGLGSLLVTFGWLVVWTMAFVGIVNSLNQVDCDTSNHCKPHLRYIYIPVLLALLFSFHWTNTVIKNIVRVTVANVIGTWWYYPEEIAPICNSAVIQPFVRAITTSLGSICLASLVVQPAQMAGTFLSWCCCGSDRSCGTSRQGGGASESSNRSIQDESAAESVGLCRRVCKIMDQIGCCARSCNSWCFTYIGMCKSNSFTESPSNLIVRTHLILPD